MRVIRGFFKGRRLVAPRGNEIRPTSDYLKESIFNILSGKVEGAVVLDLFAGTGSLGIESVSRGASCVVFVDVSPRAIKSISKNLENCGAAEHSTILRMDISKGLKSLRSRFVFDLVFMDPPYDRGLVGRTLEILDKGETLKDGAVIVVEHSIREKLPHQVFKNLRQIDERRQGNTLVSFWEYVKPASCAGMANK